MARYWAGWGEGRLRKAMEASEQAVELMRKLLTVHYVEGGVPPEVVEVLVTCLKACGDDWFPQPRRQSAGASQ